MLESALVGDEWKVVKDYVYNRNADHKLESIELEFTDGTKHLFNERGMTADITVREVTGFERKQDTAEVRDKKLLEERPDLYHELEQAYSGLESEPLPHHYDVYEWFHRFVAGEVGYDAFPADRTAIVNHEKQTVTYGNHEFSFDEVVDVLMDEDPATEHAVEQYLEDFHGKQIKYDDLTPENAPELAFDASGKPALYGDQQLHDAMKLPDTVAVVKEPSGHITSVYRPKGVIVI